MSLYNVTDYNGRLLVAVLKYADACERAGRVDGSVFHNGKLVYPESARNPSTPAPIDVLADTVPAPAPSDPNDCNLENE